MNKNGAKGGVLYRTYRPQTFADVRGQGQVTDVLQKAIKNKKTAHAYLFAGPRGTGKTTVARILAKSLGVSDKDLYEIDAASNTGVDNIRQLREAVNVLPFESPYRFYIIDEAHMLSKSAWNAFLKTLEEPPAHVIFVMATTERDKVPDTIQSRCEIYTFKQPTRETLSESVVDVAVREGFELERAGSDLVALLAEGSFRDALSILQKVLSVASGKKVTLADVEEVSGAPRGELVRRILSALAEKNAAGALAVVEEAVVENVDARILAKLLMQRMRVVLLLRFAPDLAGTLAKDLADADLDLAKSLVKSAGLNSDALRALLEAHAQMAYAVLPHLPLELAIMDLCAPATMRV